MTANGRDDVAGTANRKPSGNTHVRPGEPDNVAGRGRGGPGEPAQNTGRPFRRIIGGDLTGKWTEKGRRERPKGHAFFVGRRPTRRHHRHNPNKPPDRNRPGDEKPQGICAKSQPSRWSAVYDPLAQQLRAIATVVPVKLAVRYGPVGVSPYRARAAGLNGGSRCRSDTIRPGYTLSDPPRGGQIHRGPIQILNRPYGGK